MNRRINMSKRDYIIILLISVLVVLSVLPIDDVLLDILRRYMDISAALDVLTPYYIIVCYSGHVTALFSSYVIYCRGKKLIRKSTVYIYILMASIYFIYNFVFVVLPLLLAA